ncbi:MAG: hypothetical protein JSR77_13410 [Planctomycetes bacterium]|nr:hypothetical protein [Planctomycetota bacterium]
MSNGGKRRVVLSAVVSASGQPSSWLEKILPGTVKIGAQMVFFVPDRLGLTHEIQSICESHNGVVVSRIGVFAQPQQGGDAMVCIEAEATPRSVEAFIGLAWNRGVPLLSVDGGALDPQRHFPNRGWWRLTQGAFGAIVTEFKEDDQHSNQRALALERGKHTIDTLYGSEAKDVMDLEAYEHACRPSTKYFLTEIAEVCRKTGFNIVGAVSSPFDNGKRRRVEVLVQKPSMLGCPFARDGGMYGLKEKLELLCLSRDVDFFKVSDLERPDPEVY